MSFTKTYFLCPTSDFIHPPPIGPLGLGSIIRSTSAPQFPLNRLNAVTVTDAYPPIIETDWKKTVSAETGQGLGVFAQFLQLATLGSSPLDANVEVAHTRATGSVFAFDTLTTLSFEPSLEYVGEAIKAPAVQAWLKEPRQRFSPASVSLYLVTGIKLAKGARIRFSKEYKTTVSGHIGVDLSALGAPLTVGPKGHWTSAKADETELNRESEFVFAFCVKRLRFGRKLKVERHNKGSFMSVGDGEGEDDEGVLVEDVDGSDVQTAKVVPDGASESGSIYCALA